MNRRIIQIVRSNLAAQFPLILGLGGISPHIVNIRLTTRCSGKCRTCNHWRDASKDELTTAQWQDIIESLGKNGFSRVVFTGGDIFLRSDLFELIRYCKKKKLYVWLVTNAFSVTREKAEGLIAAGTDGIGVSLDGLSDGFDKQRGVSGASRKVAEACRLLKDLAAGSGTGLCIVPLIMRDTIASVRDVVMFAVANAIPILSFNLIHFTHYFFDNEFNRGQYDVDKDELSKLLVWLAGMKRKRPDLLRYSYVELEYARRHFEDFRQSAVPCFQTTAKICIDPNADVRACCSTEVTGNLLEERLPAVLKSRRHIDRVKRCLRKDCPGCSCRHQMNLKYDIPSNIREIAFRTGILDFARAVDRVGT